MSNSNLEFKRTTHKIFSLAIPMTGSQLINVMSGFLCMSMIAQLGPTVLAASALIFSTELSIIVMGISVLFSLSVLIGHAHGARNDDAIGIYLQLGWTLAFLISIPIILLFWNIKICLIKLGQTEEMADILQTYFRAFSLAVIPELISVCNNQFGYAIHKKWLMLSASVLSIVVLLISAYVLIFGKYGFPKLGVAGLGYARFLQNLVFVIYTTSFFYFAPYFKRYQVFNFRIHSNLKYLKKMYTVGWPMCIQIGGEMLSFFVVGIMLGWLGLEALASFQVVNQYFFIFLVAIFSLSQASGILVGNSYGAGQFSDIQKIGFASLFWVFMITLGVTLLFVIFPLELASVYLDIHAAKNAPLLDLIKMLFLIMAFLLMFDGIRHVLIGLLRGLLDTQFAMWMGLTIIWLIEVPFSYFLAFHLKMGVKGIALGGVLSMVLGAIVMYYRWHRLSSLINTRQNIGVR